MKHIGIIAKLGKLEAENTTLEIVRWLEARGIEVFVDARTAGKIGSVTPLESEEIPPRVELVIVLGGDGTLIHAASLVGPWEKPILGINLGALGFLTEITKDEMYDVLERVLGGKFEVEDRMKLNVKLIRNNRALRTMDVLNDVVVNKGALARMITMETFIGGKPLTQVKADGIIISTPTGSTAYSMAAGGPILSPSLNSIVISPICPHTLTNRPIVVSDTWEITVKLISASGKVYLTLDGQQGEIMAPGDVVEVKRASTVAKLIKSPFKDYFEILRTKLHWGER